MTRKGTQSGLFSKFPKGCSGKIGGGGSSDEVGGSKTKEEAAGSLAGPGQSDGREESQAFRVPCCIRYCEGRRKRVKDHPKIVFYLFLFLSFHFSP